MKLHVFEIDQARTDPVGHRDTMANRSRAVGAVLKNLSQATGCQYGFTGHDRHWFTAVTVQNIGTETGQRLETVGRFVGIV